MDPILLQKQVRDNSEDLSSCLKDLKLWEKEMKRKEREIYGVNGDDSSSEPLPPVRSIKKQKNLDNNKQAEEEKRKKEPRVKPYDYAAWDKFDAEKACEKVTEVPVKNIEEAIYEKENGNKFVKLRKWQDAIECYTRAIEHDNSNPIFYANRAQCLLSLEKWQDVVSDCTKALQLEAGYVKALLRRSTAYEKLKNYEGAINDLNRALELEPANKQAKSALDKVKLEAKKAEKAAAANVIVAISKPHHLRSKVPLKRIPVEEVGGDGSSIVFSPSEVPTTPTFNEPVKPTPSEPSVSKPNVVSKKSIDKMLQTTKLKQAFCETVPPKPKTAVQFMLAWSQVKPHLRYSYIKQIRGSELARLFGDSLESRYLSEVLQALLMAGTGDPVIEYLTGLTNTRRFSTLTLFMNKQDKTRVKKLLNRCVSSGACKPEEAKQLELKYEL